MYKNEPIFLSPSFQEKIWGGQKLESLFNYNIPSTKTGEAWVVSAHEQGFSKILNGPYKGKTLNFIWERHRELFGNSQDREFPLLVKIIDANEDLSVQVHPDDAYANLYENENYGKTECWYILEAEPDAEIVCGHHANSKKEFLKMIHDEDWEDLLVKRNVKKGDFIYIPSGTVHALGQGIVLLEIQQSSDITYRIYDYDRKNDKGVKRDLHLDQALDVIKIPHKEEEQVPKKIQKKGIEITHLMRNNYFFVSHYQVYDNICLSNSETFQLFNVIEGKGTIEINKNKIEIQKGDNFILPHQIKEYSLNGLMEIIVTCE